MAVAGVVHPLIDRAVPNALEVDRSVLVTGSNMSGKTTFIRALGVNAILAQTLGTVLATRWAAPWFRVRSSIGRSDDVQSGKSYYLAEVESIGALVSAARDGAQHLFLIDEIFRGTNTTERIAAGQAVLAWLDDGDNMVVVATHDLELLDALTDRYAVYHFRERVEQDALLFDYVIRPGVSSTRNAIALLRLMQFPEPLVRDALRAADRIGRSVEA
jgi:DNA mismatch repair ATPase MutS